ncbi:MULTISPECIES: hypothetical protein [Neisseria]|uniref:hypothetical protein n=1 Tax=Neisseria TaxID=482 RepID=UPI0026659AB9|nr:MULTISPECIES: hypothetical protein [Neisseria]MDO1510984.1 hypothetical protein [Neisseria sp. MVDL19-042950]MDO1517243.1 hypothetical protein [Neisseria sp. MVDL18-041461]MDO1564606.1 hypothetical protein [Neisseria sp. MVDL20-010259]MDO5070286.1 hypothetical protein [Neisseria zoodegmatis]
MKSKKIILFILVITTALIYFHYKSDEISLINESDINAINLKCYTYNKYNWVKDKLPYHLTTCYDIDDTDTTLFFLENSVTQKKYKAIKVRGKDIEIRREYYSIAAVEIAFRLGEDYHHICFPYPKYLTFEEWKPFAEKEIKASQETAFPQKINPYQKDLREMYDSTLQKDLKCRNDKI